MGRKDEELFNDIACILRAIARGQRVDYGFAQSVFEDFIAWERDERKRESCVCHQLKLINEFLRAVKSFTITQEGAPMGQINGIKVGGTGSFVATPQPAGSSLGSVVPAWTTSDTANTSITPSADGLSANLSVSASAPVGGSTNIQINATSPDGTVTAIGTATVPYLQGAAAFPTSFDISQVS